MTPVRTPDVVRGDVPGLLCRGMPVLAPIHCGDDPGPALVCGIISSVADDGPYGIDTIGYYDDPWTGRGRYHGAELTIDFTDRAAIYLCLAWLADRGHVCTWMLPTTHGGRVDAWDGMTAWEVSAILVSRSVVRVARGLGPVRDMLGEWSADPADDLADANGWPTNHHARRYGACRMLRVGSLSTGRHQSRAGWGYESCGDFYDHRKTFAQGPETGDAGKLAADRAALADGCALQVPGGILLPD